MLEWLTQTIKQSDNQAINFVITILLAGCPRGAASFLFTSLLFALQKETHTVSLLYRILPIGVNLQ